VTDDYPHMNCATARDVISARLDNAEPPTAGHQDSSSDVDAHLATCAECTAYVAGVEALHRRLRISAAAPVPDMAASIIRSVQPEFDRSHRHQKAARVILASIAALQLAVALPGLLLGHGDSLHMAREMGSWYAALAIGLLIAAWQPDRARGLFPMAGMLALLLFNTGVYDALHGHAHLFGNVQHGLSILGVFGLWFVAHPRGTAENRVHMTSMA
jgi:predicted anti-sigma-YlaC factor YlaD